MKFFRWKKNRSVCHLMSWWNHPGILAYIKGLEIKDSGTATSQTAV